MPFKEWIHTCGCFSRGEDDAISDGFEGCAECGTEGEYDGWHYSMHEAMAHAQNLWALKLNGPHRDLLSDLAEGIDFEGCTACSHGLIDINQGVPIAQG